MSYARGTEVSVERSKADAAYEGGQIPRGMQLALPLAPGYEDDES